ncbi:MAG TPA: hypothetical protein PLW75_02130 [Hyphomicrobium sp.]|nr:hypothetical protein [Hyphomicrobium sp.]
MGRIIINFEDVRRVIAGRTRARPRDLALTALLKPFLNEPSFYKTVERMPDAPPWWLTQDLIKTGRAFVFESDWNRWARLPSAQWRVLDEWLELSNTHRPDGSLREGRKWLKRLEHIKTLAEARSIAWHDTVRWSRQTPRGARARDAFHRRVADELEKTGEMVRIATVPDGRVWFELLSERAILHEGEIMQNCLLGPQRYQYMDGMARLFSLRGAGAENQVTLGMKLFPTWEARRRFNEDIDRTDEESISVLMRALNEDTDLQIRRRRTPKVDV